VILITGHATVDSAVEALRSGASDYLTKPVDIPRLKSVLANVVRRRELREEIQVLRGTLRSLGHFGPLMGSSPPIQAAYDIVARVGGETELKVDVRVVAATNREPGQAVADGKLREDLLYRLSVFPIRLPALRERAGDVELLAGAFLAEFNAAEGTRKGISRAALELLRGHSWPGNVRELKNAVHRAFILADEEISPGHLPLLRA